jgi:hypothetical protein
VGSTNRHPFEYSEDFHAEVLHRVERYRQENPRRVIEDGPADESSLGNILQFPAHDDAGLWRVHVNVSES